MLRRSRSAPPAPSATTGVPHACASTGTIPKSSVPGQQHGRPPADTAPASRRRTSSRENAHPGPASAPAAPASGPRPTMSSRAPRRRHASMARSTRLYGTSADTMRNGGSVHGSGQDGKRLYLQEDTRRSTRDYSIGGSGPQHRASSRRSGRPGPPSPHPTAPARPLSAAAAGWPSRPTCSRPEIRVELVPRIPHRRVAVADVHRAGRPQHRLHRAVAAADDQVVAVEVQPLHRSRERAAGSAGSAAPRAGSAWTNEVTIAARLDQRATPSPARGPACTAARPGRASQSASRTFSPPRIPVSQSWTSATRRGADAASTRRHRARTSP